MSGLLHFTLKESKSYKYIEIRLYGGAQAYWTETHTSGTGKHQTTHTVTYQSEETYVYMRLEFYGAVISHHFMAKLVQELLTCLFSL